MKFGNTQNMVRPFHARTNLELISSPTNLKHQIANLAGCVMLKGLQFVNTKFLKIQKSSRNTVFLEL